MAIFSLHHSFIGRSTHPAGAAGVYVRYITRSEACTVIQGERMPLDRKVYAWLAEQEKSDRKNARVIDRVVVALPGELSRDQNIELLQEFGERMTEGRTPWMAAIHDGPGDADNPHAHIVFRDRDFETGRRVMLTTEAGSTQRFRQAWEEEVNKALERAGLEMRVDRRSLADQGIDREPQLHVGAGAQRLAEREHEFRSNEKQVTRLIHGTPTEVTVNYPAIDEGRTRFEENEARKLRNWVRAQEQLALNGPARPEGLPPMERVAQATLRLDGRYRGAMRSGELPAEDGDPITAVIREHMAEREQRTADQRKPNELVIKSELLPPVNGYGSSAGPFGDDEELKRRKEEFEKVKELPGGVQLLRARDYLNALTWERGEPAPTDKELLTYLEWAEVNRIPLGKEGRQRAAERRASEGDDPKERAPRRDAADLVAGAGLAAIGRIADSLETLFDGRSAQQIERDEKMAGEKRTIEQITEEQQRKQEAEAGKWRQIELELYLAQRDRERHIDRGR
jgi:MobA/MobL family